MNEGFRFDCHETANYYRYFIRQRLGYSESTFNPSLVIHHTRKRSQYVFKPEPILK